MRLRTLGGLALEGTAFARVVPLTLLAYLALEGESDRTRLCRLLWPSARDPRRALRGALSRLRRAAPGCVDARNGRVRAHVATDVDDLRHVLREGRVDDAIPYLRRAYAQNEQWATLVERLPEAGLLPSMDLATRLVEAMTTEAGN